MMRILILGLIFLLVVTVANAGKHEHRYFTVKITITYNKATLQQAARLEQSILETYTEACNIDFNVKPINPYSYNFSVEDFEEKLKERIGRFKLVPSKTDTF